MALSQLGDVVEYVADNYGMRTAQNVYDKIDKKVQDLLKQPESGRYDGVNLSMEYPLRHLTIVPNILYYFVNTEDDKLVILAVVHSRQSPRTINSILKRSLEQYRKLKESPIQGTKSASQTLLMQ